MGDVVTFANLPFRETGPGVQRAAVTGSAMKALSAEVIRLGPGARLIESVPRGSDRYLFTLTGGAAASARGQTQAMGEESFATVEEGVELVMSNPNRTEATLVSVLAPPSGSPASPASRAGFSAGLVVAARATTPVHDVPEEKKRRIYFVGQDAARSERAHRDDRGVRA